MARDLVGRKWGGRKRSIRTGENDLSIATSCSHVGVGTEGDLTQSMVKTRH